ncbi:MAG: hypothetical protein V3U75_04065 [Methylococcaceae bacterium]
MAQQILSPIDLRSTAERQGITRNMQTAQALARILKTAGRAEQVRQERKTLDRIATAIAGGATTIEAISAVAKQRPEFGGGFTGGLQRLASAFQPSPGRIGQGIQEDVIGSRLREILSPSLLTREEQGKAARIKAGLEPAAGEAPAAFEQTAPEKARNRDIKILTDRHKTGGSKDQLIATPVQQKSARRRMRANPSIGDIQPGKIDYTEVLKGKPRVKAGALDKAFGEEAYNQALQEIKDTALAQGATESSVENDFNVWWDKQVEKEKGETFTEFVPRQDFKGSGKKALTKLDQATAAKILQEVGGDKEKARELAKKRGFEF